MHVAPKAKCARDTAFALLLSLAAPLSGCDGVTGMVPIRGVVKFRGVPLRDGEIRYVPADKSVGRMARAKIGEDGSFSLTTATRGDGAMHGEYRVVVIAYGPEIEPTRDAQGFVLEAPPRPLLVPQKYANPATTPLKDTVNDDHDEFVEITLE